VPPGFTITTEACRFYLEPGHEHDQLCVQVTMAYATFEDGRWDRSLVGPSPPSGPIAWAWEPQRTSATERVVGRSAAPDSPELR
jgi:hypothetical protein